jgi:hypothetical protein
LRNKTYARYPSLSDVERCSREALERHDERGGGRSSVTGTHSFTGTKDMQTFLDMLSNGWPEGIAEAKGLDGLASDHHERLQFERNVSGAFVNVPAHLQGDPMSMLNPVIAPSDNTRSLTLVVDNCYNCNIESNAVLRYAQEIMRVVAWLSAERIECSVVSVTSEKYNGNLYYWVTEVKRKGDVLQPERIATCVHTSFFRRGWFSVMEHEHHEHQLKGSDACLGGYGYSVTPELSDLPTLLDEDVSSIVMLPKADNHGDAGHAIDTAINLKLKRK